ncbi:MAG: glycosyltransferase [Phycisphaerae bacterium]|nr:glycosyltransferase [Phycisphaerae bacterium]
MKIAVITTSFPCLSETFILNQITGLIDLGHDVRVIAWRDSADSVVHPDVARYNLRARTRYIPPVPQSKALCLIKALQLIVTNLPKGPGPLLRFVHMFARRRKGLSLQHLYFLLYFLDDGFDVIHCHYGPNGLIGAFLKEAGINSKVGTVFHGFDVSRYPLTSGLDVYNTLFEKCDLCMPISEYWKHRLVELGCKPDNIVVHRMGIDLQRFACVDRKYDAGPFKLLTLGRLVEKKGHEYVLRAIAKLIDKGYDVAYTVAGDGPLRDSLEALAAHLGIGSHVTFAGPVTGDEAIMLYHSAHIFLLPSVTAADGDMEGVPVVLMEALATGMPAVASDHSGIGEIIIDGETGFLVPERDVDALAERVQYLLDNQQLWPATGRQGRSLVEEQYDISKLNRKLELTYRQLWAGEKPRT